MTSTEVRERVKERLDIPSSSSDFDTVIDHAVEDALPRLAPYFRTESMTSGELSANTNEIVASDDVTKLWLALDGTHLQPYSNYRVHNGTIYLDTQFDEAVSYRYLERKAHTYANIANLPTVALPALYLFAMAEFATLLVGNKRKFNIYQQSNGVRTLDEFKDLAEWYELRAVRICEDVQGAEGA